ncbi:MAG: WecB/TagA/CpsF family glycosyltransferase [bacterium]|nr:WecB/TagA/CpsF family glycosyltransferase [bacterium]
MRLILPYRSEAKLKSILYKKNDDKVNILGVDVSVTSIDQVLGKIDQICTSSFKKPFLIVTVNPEFIMVAQEDNEFQTVLNSADLAIADGNGLKLAKPDLPIVPGRKLVQRILDHNYRIFFLGGRDKVAEKMAQRFGGAFSPGHADIKQTSPIGSKQNKEDEEIVTKINAFRPDILLVAYGAPWQEKWIWAHRSQLKVKVAMGVGGTFDYLVGLAKLPPEWINKLGLEWAWRLIHEPWRWRRQLRLFKFVWKLI